MKQEHKEFIPKDLGKHFQKARKALGFSQSNLKEEFGLCVNSISRIENAHDAPSLCYFYKLIEKGVNPFFLLSGKDGVLFQEQEPDDLEE